MYASRYGGGMGSYGMGMGGGMGYGGGMMGGSMGTGMYGMNSMGMGMNRGYGMSSGYGSQYDMNNTLGASSGALDANGLPFQRTNADGTVALIGDQQVQTKPLTPQQAAAQRAAQVAEHKRQRKMFLMEATLQVVSGAMQLLMQLIMGMRDVAGIVMGVYYSYYTLRSFRQSISGAPPNAGELMRQTGVDMYGKPTYSLVTSAQGSSGSGSFMRALKIILGAAAIYSVAQTALSAYQVARHNQQEREQEERQRKADRRERRRAARRNKGTAENADAAYSTDDFTSDSDSSSETSSLEDELNPSEPRGRIRHTQHTTSHSHRAERRIYVAKFDHEATMRQGDDLSFKAGDQFEIDDFDGNSWCSAVRLGSDGTRSTVLVPGNYLSPLQLQQKI